MEFALFLQHLADSLSLAVFTPWLYHGLRHLEADQFCPWRSFYGRGLLYVLPSFSQHPGISVEPQLFLLDEAAAGMNPQESGELMAFIHQIRDRFKITILMREHHMQVVLGVFEKILVLDYGVSTPFWVFLLR